MMITLLIAKTICGEHRPHFLDKCQSDAVNCTIGSLVTNYTCTNQNISRLRMQDISRSFPSGHASLAVYFSGFMIWFLQQRIPKMNSKYFIPLVQTALMVYAMICGITRISDNAHHPNDVLFGFLLGIGFFIFNVSLIHLVCCILSFFFAVHFCVFKF